MPQLPPVAAAAFVLCLLGVILVATAVVQIRSRRRRTRLARMVRATAPIPRSSLSILGQPPEPEAAPLHGRSYRSAVQEGRFRAFEERLAREPQPGRPARRLAAAQVSEATAPDVPVAPAPTPLPPQRVVPVAEPVAGPALRLAAASHAGLAEVCGILWGSEAAVRPADPPMAVRLPTEETPAVEPLAIDAPASETLSGPASETALPEPAVVAAVVEEPSRLAFAEPPPAPAPTPRGREPQIMVLPPRQAVPAFPTLMTREITLAEAARAFRGTLPGILTMTDGRQLRRAVAIGAATSVLVAAFAIRGRHR